MKGLLPMMSRVLLNGVVFLQLLASRKAQIKFTDRHAAGQILGKMIMDEINKIGIMNGKDGEHNHIRVLGIPRGGVITALPVSFRLNAKLGVVISRRLVAPYNKEITIGSIIDRGDVYLNDEVIRALNVSQEYIDTEMLRQMHEINSGSSANTFTKAAKLKEIVRGKIIVLVDDGAASGATMLNAVRYVKSYEPKYIIVGIPIAPKQTVNLLKKEADQVLCIFEPRNKTFRSVEDYYVDFSNVTDVQVAEAMSRKKL